MVRGTVTRHQVLARATATFGARAPVARAPCRALCRGCRECRGCRVCRVCRERRDPPTTRDRRPRHGPTCRT